MQVKPRPDNSRPQGLDGGSRQWRRHVKGARPAAEDGIVTVNVLFGRSGNSVVFLKGAARLGSSGISIAVIPELLPNLRCIFLSHMFNNLSAQKRQCTCVRPRKVHAQSLLSPFQFHGGKPSIPQGTYYTLPCCVYRFRSSVPCRTKHS